MKQMMTLILMITILIILTILGKAEFTILDENVKLIFKFSLNIKVYSLTWFSTLYDMLQQPELEICSCSMCEIEITCSINSSVL